MAERRKSYPLTLQGEISEEAVLPALQTFIRAFVAQGLADGSWEIVVEGGREVARPAGSRKGGCEGAETRHRKSA